MLRSISKSSISNVTLDIEGPTLDMGVARIQMNGLRANIFSILDAGPLYSIQNPLIDIDCCDKQQPRGFSGQCIKISLKCPNVSPCFACGELDYGVGSNKNFIDCK